jgi:signal transduction histidine kinase
VETTKTTRKNKKGKRGRQPRTPGRPRLSAAQKYTQQLEKLNRLQAELIANVSHEFRTPLNGILGYTELLREGIYGHLTEEQLEVVDNIRACGNHLLDLVNEILDLARLKKHQMQLEFEHVSPAELVEAAAAAVQPLAQKRNLNLITSCETDLPALLVDFRRIYQVLLNLLSNAIKFTNEGIVEIGVRREENNLRFHVKDTGIGITPEFARHVFKDFRQQDGTSTRPFGGVGLGLSLSKRLVELHGGKIGFESNKNQGAEFYFYIPLPSPAETPAASPTPTSIAHHQHAEDASAQPEALTQQNKTRIAGPPLDTVHVADSIH